MSTLSSRRLTVPDVGKSIRDDWRTVAVGDGPSAGERWVGKCVFYETWNDATESAEVDPVSRTVHSAITETHSVIRWRKMQKERLTSQAG